MLSLSIFSVRFSSSFFLLVLVTDWIFNAVGCNSAFEFFGRWDFFALSFKRAVTILWFRWKKGPNLFFYFLENLYFMYRLHWLVKIERQINVSITLNTVYMIFFCFWSFLMVTETEIQMKKWSRSGKEYFYVRQDKIYDLDVFCNHFLLFHSSGFSIQLVWMNESKCNDRAFFVFVFLFS